METSPPTAIDLFCGAGGLSTGLEWAGFNIQWAIDTDKAARKTYRQNHSDVTLAPDGFKEEAYDFPKLDRPVDLVAGGPPCPPFSVVGRSKLQSIDGREAATDSRTQLWEQLRDAVQRYEPKAFLMENVQGMESAVNEAGESVLQYICSEFRKLGYNVRPKVVDAANFGVPQHRKRLFILGIRGETRPPRLEEWRTHREPESDRERQPRFVPESERTAAQRTLNDWGVDSTESTVEGKPVSCTPWVTVAEAISDLPPLSPGESTDIDLHPPSSTSRYTIRPVTEYQEWAREDVPTISDKKGEEAERPVLYNHEARYHNMTDLSIYSMLGAGMGWRIGDLPDDLQPYRSDVFQDNYTKQRPDRPSSTIPAHIHKDGHMHIHPHEARSFTVREAARLQSFPDRFIFPVSRTEAYRQVGNAVPPKLAEACGKAILESLESLERR